MPHPRNTSVISALLCLLHDTMSCRGHRSRRYAMKALRHQRVWGLQEESHTRQVHVCIFPHLCGICLHSGSNTGKHTSHHAEQVEGHSTLRNMFHTTGVREPSLPAPCCTMHQPKENHMAETNCRRDSKSQEVHNNALLGRLHSSFFDPF